MSRIRLAAHLWASSIQVFLAKGLVALGWARPYSLASRCISDLGNTACAEYPVGSAMPVCSPRHIGMSVLGAAGLAGATSRRFDGFTATMGMPGLIGTALFVVGHHPGMGQGGMERSAAFPLTVWLIVAGVRLW